jgi:hypothetical protein
MLATTRIIDTVLDDSVVPSYCAYDPATELQGTQSENQSLRDSRSPFLIIFFSSTHDMIMNDVVYI